MDNEFANMWISMQKKHLPCPCTCPSLLWFCFTLPPWWLKFPVSKKKCSSWNE
jgi:hypothetical protein